MRRPMVVSGSVLVLLLGAWLGAAQEAPEASASPEASERPAIRVLAHPYDLASFYRSDAGSAPGDVRTNPSAIAGFYRTQGSASSFYPFAPYWSSNQRSWGDPLRLRSPEAGLEQRPPHRRAPRPQQPEPESPRERQ